MRVSLNQVKQYIDFELPPVDELVRRINEQLGGVEEVIDLADKYKDAVIVKVVAAEKHPSADRLNVCRVDDGGKLEDVDRGDDGLVQVVCGAPNVREGMYAVWLPPRSVVPASYSDEAPFVLGARELRGLMSQGMLAAADELGIGNDHEGILEIDPDEWKPGNAEIKPGASFAEAYGLNDTIIDIENKMFTHRPDLFGQLGVAREIAGILGHKFISPDWYTGLPKFTSVKEDTLPLEVFNEAGDNVPRIMFAAMKNIEVKPSPLWLQCALVAMGSKPISNIVDVTNYVMLLTAQPTHAYDYDKIRGHKIGARMAKKGEKIKLLNDKTYELTEDDIVIADAEGPIGLGGIMGGGESEVDENTKNIVLEVATFDMYTARKSAMRHGVFTDALTRFNKGQSPLQNDHIMNLLMMSVKDVSSAEQASEVFDLGSPEWPEPVQVTDEFINERLGLKLQNSDITNLLTNVELFVDSPDDHDTYLELSAPFWRTDLELPEDIVEEVGRLYGFDKLPRELPKRTMKPSTKDAQITLKQRIREHLSRAGANEVLTYSFVHENVLRRADQDPDEAYRLSNALSPDLQYYRLSLTPSLLDKVYGNIRAGFDEFALFEIGKAHTKQAELDEEGLPVELGRIGLVYASKYENEGAAYFKAKGILEYLGRMLGLELACRNLSEESSLSIAKPFDLTRSARVVDVRSGQPVGIIGEYGLHVKRAFKLPDYAAGFELLLEGLGIAAEKAVISYEPLSKYPSLERDVTFVVDASMSYSDLMDAVNAVETDPSVRIDVKPKDIYQAEAPEPRHITLTFTLSPEQATLTSDQANEFLARIISAVEVNTSARVVS